MTKMTPTIMTSSRNTVVQHDDMTKYYSKIQFLVMIIRKAHMDGEVVGNVGTIVKWKSKKEYGFLSEK